MIIKESLVGPARYAEHRVFSRGHTDPRGGILLHGERPDWVHLNPSAREIVELRRAGRTVREIARLLASRHGLAVAPIEADIRSTLDKLAAEGFGLGKARSLRREPNLNDLFIHITERCNLACAHCYAACSPRRTLDMPTETLLGLVSQLADLGGESISLSGGEPFLHPGFKKVLMAAAPKLRIKIATNGVLIDDAWASFLAPLRPLIQISLDGPDARSHDAIRGRGAFAGALRAVGRLQKAGLGPNLALAATMQDGNAGRLDDIIRLARRLGIPRLRFLPLRKVGRASENWSRVGAGTPDRVAEDLFDHIRSSPDAGAPGLSITCGVSGFIPFRAARSGGDGFWCPVGRYLSIAADGRVYPCILMMSDAFLLGRVPEQSLAQILRSRGLRGITRTLAGRRKAIPKCARCLWRNFCQAGCMAVAVERKNTLFAADRLCSYRMKLYQSAFDKILDRAAAGGASRADV